MEGFINSIPGGETRERVIRAIREQGLQHFEDAVREERLLIAWYNYREEIYSEFSRRWCGEKGLELIE